MSAIGRDSLVVPADAGSHRHRRLRLGERRPAALARDPLRAVIEVLVFRFEETEVVRVQRVFHAVGPEQDPILILVDEPSRSSRQPTELAPEDCPATVTRPGSTPNDPMLSLTHRSAEIR